MILPNVDMNLLDQPTLEKVQAKALNHPPRILLLYGSNRERSYSRLAVMEAGRIFEQFGAEVKIFHPKGLPLPEDADMQHPKVNELHELLAWSECMVWCSPERHGSMSSIFKSQICSNNCFELICSVLNFSNKCDKGFGLGACSSNSA